LREKNSKGGGSLSFPEGKRVRTSKNSCVQGGTRRWGPQEFSVLKGMLKSLGAKVKGGKK